MKRRNVELLSCSACHNSYEVRVIEGTGSFIEKAYLTCPDCCITIPLIHGFPLFQEQFLTETPSLEKIDQRVFGSRREYEYFLDAKQQKPSWDLYAAFQPFNESTQALFPLVGFLRDLLKPGDLILDLWCRTGWSGELLAALFPDNQVISLWESYSGVLGAKGFQYWLNSSRRRSNLDIIFHSPNDPFPFGDQTFCIVHGLDTLHRYHHVPLISECLRIVQPNGAIFFPHCHLTNSEPEPYFDRGEDQLHGTEYDAFFSRLFASGSWKGYVLSEKKLFDAGETYVLEHEPDTAHYNAAILLTDRRHDHLRIAKTKKTIGTHANAFIIINPLYEINLTTREVKPNGSAMDHGGDELFYRHPMYLERLKTFSPLHLSDLECVVLFWAKRCLTVSQIAAKLGVELKEIFKILIDLEQKEVVQIQNVSEGMARLQSFYASQQILHPIREATLTSLWTRTQNLYPEKTCLVWPEDESVFSYADCDRMIRSAAEFLTIHGVKKGDRVIICSEYHPEFFFLFWGIILSGAVAVPIHESREEPFRQILAKTKPVLIFTSAPVGGVLIEQNIPVIAFAVSEDSLLFAGSFSESLAECPPMENFPDASPDQDAAILFTSGSTGIPKGVVLSHGALVRSSECMASSYHFRSSDVFLGLAGIHTMSGLRNPCIAAPLSGMALVLPSADQARDPMAILHLCIQFKVTILNAGPTFLAYWNRASQKAGYFKDHRLRMLLSTGSKLHAIHRKTFESNFSCPVYDYYGLTETSGICVMVNSEIGDLEANSIGRACDSLVRVVDEHDQPLDRGEVGELVIYSDNLMTGYLGDPGQTGKRVRNGWFYTGDMAYINDHGCVILLGRKDRMLVDKNGENVYPDEIERHMSQISRVRECFVTGYTDRMMVDQIGALVALDSANTSTDCEQFIRSELAKRIPSHLVPSLILIVDEIPKGPGGKVSTQMVQQQILKNL